MIATKLKGVEFMAANTDSQDLERSACSNRMQLGLTITKGLGAGSDPEIGRLSAEESIEDIKESRKLTLSEDWNKISQIAQQFYIQKKLIELVDRWQKELFIDIRL